MSVREDLGGLNFILRAMSLKLRSAEVFKIINNDTIIKRSSTMKGAIIAMIGAFVCVSLTGQETKRVVKYFPNSNQVMEEYHVLAANETIKQGEYIRYYQLAGKGCCNCTRQFICKKGYYNNNQPDSTWVYYHYDASYYRIEREETYKEGRKAGIWKTYVEWGAVITRYDYDLNKPLEPEFRFSVPYPALAKEMRMEGMVKVQVLFNNDCSVAKIVVIQKANPVLDDSSLTYVADFERLRLKYTLTKDCPNKKDTTYILNYKLE